MTDPIFIAFVEDESELYSDLCDAAARELYDIPDNDRTMHTGDLPRAIASRVLALLREKSGDPDRHTMLEKLQSHPAVQSGSMTVDELLERLEAYQRARSESIDAYKDIGADDANIIGVAWRDPDDLVPVFPGSFRTWFVHSDAPHGVAFFRKDSGEHVEGDGSDVFGVVWLEDTQVRHAYFGQVPPKWASGEKR